MTVIVDIQRAVDQDCPDDADFVRWAEAALHQEKAECELCIRLVDEEESARLNTDYRHRTGPTNVLSFPFEAPVALVPRLLGDLVICAPLVNQEAQAQGKSSQDHWAHLVVHGCLHLLGYDHVEDAQAQEMEALEIAILQSLAISNPYQETL